MNNDQLLGTLVREWAAEMAPDDPRVADRAMAVALRSYRGGAPVSVACEQARAFVGSWLRHPSNYRASSPCVLRSAS